MSHPATVTAGPSPAQQLAGDIRRAADWIERHPQLVYGHPRVNVHLDPPWRDRGLLAAILDAFGEEAVIDTGSSLCAARLNLGERVFISTMFDRDAHCTPRIEAGEVVYDLALDES